jgi:hypothetical protein
MLRRTQHDTGADAQHDTGADASHDIGMDAQGLYGHCRFELGEGCVRLTVGSANESEPWMAEIRFRQ